MDKYEFNTRIDQIKKAMIKKDFKTATQTADMIDWAKVKNNSILLLVADAYEADRQYEKAKEVLLVAYKRAPMGRQLAYRLALLSVKMKDFVDAEEFYMDFTQIAPSDTAAYILKYRIAKGRGESKEALIQILEAYNEVDMEEKWAYCLAKLYDDIGDKEKCVNLCDEISLWFNEGTYVTKALKLKQKYTPLTRGQAERLEISATKVFEPIKDDFYEESDAKSESESSENESPESESADSENAENKEATKVIPTISEEEYPEIKVKEFSGNGSDTIDIQETIAKSMEILMNDSENDKIEEEQPKLGNTNSILNPIYKMEGDGQISLDVEDDKKVEKQITGQLDIEAVLKDFESRGILNKHTVSSTVDAMDKAASVVEQAKVETEEYLSIRRTSSLMEAIEKISEDEDIDDIVDEAEENASEEDLVVDDIIETPEEEEFEEPGRLNTADLEEISEALELMTEQVANSEAEDSEDSDSEVAEDAADTEDTSDVVEESDEESNEEETDKSADAAEKIEADTDKVELNSEKARLSDEDAKHFASFLTITGLEEKLVNTIKNLGDIEKMDGTSQKNNIIIMGDEKSGKTTLAIELIKVINEKRGRTGRRIAKVNATALNNRGFSNSLNKLLKCDLIIEDASELDEEIIEEITDSGRYYTDDMIIALEDAHSKMRNLIEDYPELEEMFGNKLILKEFSLKEWLNYAEDYAEEQGYMIDSVGQLALAHSIDEIYGINQGIEKEDIQEIIDNAINKSKKKMGRKIARIFGSKNDELDLEVLKEKDFI